MERLAIFSMVMVIVLTSILIRDFIKTQKTKRMVKRTIENCFNILKEKAKEDKDEERV